MKRFLAGLILAIGTLVSVAPAVEAADPGIPIPDPANNTMVSDQQNGFMLIYNFYTSSPANPATHNTRFSITNTYQYGLPVHLFFVDGTTCSISDRFLCLTGNQTTSFLASDQDPGTTGYLIAITVDDLGRPIPFDGLIGDAYVKTQVGFFGSLAAEAIPSYLARPFVFPGDDSVVGLAVLGMPRVLAVDNIGSRADGNETLLVINGVGGDLRVSGAPTGNLFGILYDDAEQAHSWNRSGGCQIVTPLSNDFPKTAPRFDVVIPAGQSGWMKFWSTSTINNSPIGTSADSRALLGAVFQRNNQVGTASGAFQGARNLHKLRVLSVFDPQATAPQQVSVFLIPVFPPNCGIGIRAD